MAHGYLGDGYGTHGEIDPDRGDDRRWREGNWRREDNDWRNRAPDRASGAMFRGSNHWRDRPDEDRWSGSGPSNPRYREHGHGAFQDRGGYAQYSDSGRNVSANPDDHYRSWRDRHMSEVDRDYADYCREREQQFHRDFDQWRRNRGPGNERRRDEIAQEAELELTHERALAEEGNTPSPVGDATLGTNNSENTITGRARPRR